MRLSKPVAGPVAGPASLQAVRRPPGIGFVVAAEDRQTDVRARLQKLVEVLDDFLVIVPFALRDQAGVEQWTVPLVVFEFGTSFWL